MKMVTNYLTNHLINLLYYMSWNYYIYIFVV